MELIKNKKSIDKNSKRLMIIFLLVILSLIGFLIIDVDSSNLNYVLSERIPRLIAIIVAGTAIGFSTVVFQSITNNRIITPNVLGLDSLYVFLQSLMVFILGSGSFFISNKIINFFITILFMIFASIALYKYLFKEGKINIVYLVLIGMIFGTLFSSLSSFMQMIMDPNEFLVLQNKLFASFNNINVDILFISLIMLIFIGGVIFEDLKYLDLISLGKDQSINLGLDYNKVVKKLLIIVAIFISIATALVGPITFLGLLVVNITKEVIKSYKHSLLLPTSILISIFTLVFGELLVKKVLNLNTPVTVIINLLGGIYFIYILIKENSL